MQAANLINSMHATMKIITRLQLDYARMDRRFGGLSACLGFVFMIHRPQSPLSRVLLIKYASRQQQQQRATRILFV